MPNTYELAQFHFSSPEPIEHWVKQIPLKSTPAVIEIGPGNGEITQFLLESAKEVKAIEYDREREETLNALASKHKNLKVFFSDFTKFTIFDEHYIVAANIPFNLTRKIFENLLAQKYIAKSIFLVLQKEVVAKICQQKRSNVLGVYLQTFYNVRPHMRFKREDFKPRANVDIQAIEMHKSDIESNRSDRKKFLKLLNTSFETTGKTLKAKLKKMISHKQIKLVCKEFNITDETKPQEIAPAIWWNIFKYIQPFL